MGSDWDDLYMNNEHIRPLMVINFVIRFDLFDIHTSNDIIPSIESPDSTRISYEDIIMLMLGLETDPSIYKIEIDYQGQDDASTLSMEKDPTHQYIIFIKHHNFGQSTSTQINESPFSLDQCIQYLINYGITQLSESVYIFCDIQAWERDIVFYGG